VFIHIASALVLQDMICYSYGIVVLSDFIKIINLFHMMFPLHKIFCWNSTKKRGIEDPVQRTNTKEIKLKGVHESYWFPVSLVLG
jgi:hypothetical protein